MKIANKIKQTLQNPQVQKNRRQIKAMSYIIKHSNGNAQFKLTPATFQTVHPNNNVSTPIQGWYLCLIEPFILEHNPHSSTSELIPLFPLSNFNENNTPPQLC